MKHQTPNFLIIGLIIILLAACSSGEPEINNEFEKLPPPAISVPGDNNNESDVEPMRVSEVSYSLDSPDNGLYLDPVEDTQIEIVDIPRTDRQAMQTGNGAILPADDKNDIPDTFLQFKVDDAVLFEGSPTHRVVIEIEYLDEGTDTFMIHYDATSGIYTPTGFTIKEDTGEIRTASISICDAFFGNLNNGSDFRIADNMDGPETILSVTVRLIPEAEEATVFEVDSCGANPFDDQPDSAAIQDCLNLMCSGDVAVFTSPEDDPDYQGYQIDKTIFLMLNGVKSNLTFTSSNPNQHAQLKANADLKGYVVQLFSKSMVQNTGLIDDILLQHLDIDSNRQERACVGPNGYEDGSDDNYGSWLPECPGDPDPWCSAGGLGMNGGFNPIDVFQTYEENLQFWSTGLEVQDVVISNVECGSALVFSGAAGKISNVTIDTAGDHVHIESCQQTDPDELRGTWSDGMTIIGPAHVIENNTVINPSDIGIVHFGGRNIVIRNNTIISEDGNYGAFAAIALHPWWFGINGDYQIIGNTVINESDSTCGGFHAGINIGGNMWGMGCPLATNIAAIGNPNSCSPTPIPPGPTSCADGELCQIWAYVPEDTTFTLKDNNVTGAQINSLIGGIQFDGDFIDENNISNTPRDTDWQGANSCGVGDIFRTWGQLDFVAFNPTLDGWTPLEVYCER